MTQPGLAVLIIICVSREKGEGRGKMIGLCYGECAAYIENVPEPSVVVPRRP